MSYARLCLIFGSLLLTAACTQATPDFEVLDEDGIPRPLFAGNTVKRINASSSSTTFTIHGECDPKIRGLLGSAVGTSTNFSSVNALAVSGITVSCATDGKFSFELKSLADLGFSIQEGETYEIQLRAQTSAGKSKPSSIRITYSSASGGQRPILITSGATLKATDGTAGGFSAQVRVTNKMNQLAGQVQASADEAGLKTGPNGISAQIGVRMGR